MEQNLPIMAKKFMKIVKVIYFMLKKGISKGKLLHDLHMMMKRGKIAGKAAIHNLIFHHHHHGGASASASTSGRHLTISNEYEFSCSNSPAFHLFHLNNRKHSQPTAEDLMAMAMAAEMFSSAGASPALPGFGPSPMVRQLRITDSSFPLRDGEDQDGHVDAAAEEFITKFYKDLRQQNSVGYLGYY